HFAGGADEQVGIRVRRGVEAGGDEVFVELQGVNTAIEAGPFGDGGGGGVDDVGAAPVVDGEVERHAAIGGRSFDGVVELAADLYRKSVDTADDLKTNVVALEGWEFLIEVIAEQAPEGFDFVARALPVLNRECIKR